MCVKEFLGYNCGHCSIPFLRKCPITTQHDDFPTCQFPAERPIFTNENCHACSRILWNIQVLKEEEEHRGRHYHGQCECSVVFDKEDTERHLRRRPAKGKGRGRGRGQETSHGEERSNSGRREGEQAVSGDHYPVRGHEDQGRSGHGAHAGAGPSYVNKQESGANPVNQQFAWPGLHLPAPDREVIEHFHRGEGYPPGGSMSREAAWAGQTVMNQPGAGMKWYPQYSSNTGMPVLPPFPTAPAPATTHTSRHNNAAAHRRGSPPNQQIRAQATRVHAPRVQASKIQHEEQQHMSYNHAFEPTGMYSEMQGGIREGQAQVSKIQHDEQQHMSYNHASEPTGRGFGEGQAQASKIQHDEQQQHMSYSHAPEPTGRGFGERQAQASKIQHDEQQQHMSYNHASEPTGRGFGEGQAQVSKIQHDEQQQQHMSYSHAFEPTGMYSEVQGGFGEGQAQASKIQHGEQQQHMSYSHAPEPTGMYSEVQGGFGESQNRAPKEETDPSRHEATKSPTPASSDTAPNDQMPREPRIWQKKAKSEGGERFNQFPLTPLDTSVSVETILAHEKREILARSHEAPAIASRGMADAISE